MQVAGATKLRQVAAEELKPPKADGSLCVPKPASRVIVQGLDYKRTVYVYWDYSGGRNRRGGRAERR